MENIIDRDILIRKVKAKLANKEIDGGLKEWLAAGLVAFSSIFGGIDKALGSALDLDQFLAQTSKKVKMNKDIKDHVEVNKSFKSLGGENGVGYFNVKVGPFAVRGDYKGYGDLIQNLKIKIEAPKNTSKDEIEKWKPLAFSLYNDIDQAFFQQKQKDKKEIKSPKKQQHSIKKIVDKQKDNMSDTWEEEKKRNNDMWEEEKKRNDDMLKEMGWNR
jgi:hypothetical protein